MENKENLIKALIYFGVKDIVNLTKENFEKVVVGLKNNKDNDFQKNYQQMINLLEKSKEQRINLVLGDVRDSSKAKIIKSLENHYQGYADYNHETFENVLLPIINSTYDYIAPKPSQKQGPDSLRRLLQSKNPNIEFYFDEGDIIGNDIIMSAENIKDINIPDGFVINDNEIVNKFNPNFKENFSCKVIYRKKYNIEDLIRNLREHNPSATIKFENKELKMDIEMHFQMPKGFVIENGKIINKSNNAYEKISYEFGNIDLDMNSNLKNSNIKGTRARGIFETDLEYVTYLKEHYEKEEEKLRKLQKTSEKNENFELDKQEMNLIKKPDLEQNEKKEGIIPIDPIPPRVPGGKTGEIIPINPVPIKVVGHDIKKTKKTLAAIALGVGLGVAVKFASTLANSSVPMLGSVVTMGYMAGAHFVERKIKAKRAVLKMEKELNGVVTDLSKPNAKEMKGIEKFKNYINSEEGLRDLSYLVNTSMITLTTLSVADVLTAGTTPTTTTPDAAYTPGGDTAAESLLESMTNNPADATSSLTEALQSSTDSLQTGAEALQSSTDSLQTGAEALQTGTESLSPALENINVADIQVGGDLEGLNLSTGHDVAYDASQGLNPESLIERYVNPDTSTISEFRVFDNDGNLLDRISDEGITVNEIMSKYNVSPNNIVANVVNAQDGTPLAWISADGLTSTVTEELLGEALKGVNR